MAEAKIHDLRNWARMVREEGGGEIDLRSSNMDKLRNYLRLNEEIVEKIFKEYDEVKEDASPWQEVRTSKAAERLTLLVSEVQDVVEEKIDIQSSSKEDLENYLFRNYGYVENARLREAVLHNINWIDFRERGVEIDGELKMVHPWTELPIFGGLTAEEEDGGGLAHEPVELESPEESNPDNTIEDLFPGWPEDAPDELPPVEEVPAEAWDPVIGDDWPQRDYYETEEELQQPRKRSGISKVGIRESMIEFQHGRTEVNSERLITLYKAEMAKKFPDPLRVESILELLTEYSIVQIKILIKLFS